MIELRNFVAAAGAAVILGGSAGAATDKCLQGASVATDTTQIEAVRKVVDTFCDCDAFDGLEKTTTRGKFVKRPRR